MSWTDSYAKLSPPPVCSECGCHSARCQYDDDRGVTRCGVTEKPATVVQRDARKA